MGCITALGETADEFFGALCQGKSGIATIESFDTTAYPVHFGGEIKHFDVTKYIDFRESKRMDRFSQFAVSAAIQAVKESGLDFSKEDPYRMGVIVGTGIGGIKEIEEQHLILLKKAPMRISPFTVPRLMANAAAGNIAIQYGLRGPNFCVSSACASSNHAIGEAFCNIIAGRSDIVVTGGTEAALTP
jgi:3-oxoacyl-[acyl-carrier-protein] synthase II